MKPSAAPHGTLFFSQEQVRTARRRLRQKGRLGDQARGIVAEADDLLNDLSGGRATDWIEELRPFSSSWLGKICPACGREGRWWRWQADQPESLTCGTCRHGFPSEDYPETHAVHINEQVYRAHVSPAGLMYFFSAVARGFRFTTATRVFHAPVPLAYLLTGEERYATPIVAALTKLAQVYPDYPMLHDSDSPSRRGRDARLRGYVFPEATFAYRAKMWQWGDAALLYHALLAFDAIRDSAQLTDPVVEFIRESYVREALESFVINKLFYTLNRFHNSFGDYYSAMALAGRLFGTSLVVHDRHDGAFELSGPDLVHEVIDGASGIRHFFTNAYGADGLYYENTYSYHVHALKVMLPALVALRGYSDPSDYRPSAWCRRRHRPYRDLDLGRCLPRYMRVLHAFDRLHRPDLTAPPNNDAFGDTLSQMSAFLYMAAHVLTGSVSAGRIASTLLERDAHRELTEHLGGDDYYFLNYTLFGGRLPSPLPGERPIVLKPDVCTSGFGVLRHDDDTALHLSWDEPRQFHSHADQLGLQLFARGREMLIDLGYMGAMHLMRHVWLNRTIAHNTVTVDEQTQRFAMGDPGGRLLHFGVTRDASVLEAEAADCYRAPSVYRRLTALIPVGPHASYVADVFDVEGGDRHDYALLAASNDCRFDTASFRPTAGTLAGRDVAYPHVEALDTSPMTPENGYKFIHDLQTADLSPTDPRASVTWHFGEQARLTAHVLGPPEARVVIGTYPVLRGHAWHRDPDRLREGRMLVVRNKPSKRGRSSFATVLVPATGDACVTEARRIHTGQNGTVIRVDHAGGHDLLLRSLGGTPALTWTDCDTDASLAVVRRSKKAALKSAALFGGTRLDMPGLEIRLTPPPRASIRTVDLSSARLALTASFPPGKILRGEILQVSHKGRPSILKVASVEGRAVTVDTRHTSLTHSTGCIDSLVSRKTFFTATPMTRDLAPGDLIWLDGTAFTVSRFQRTGTDPDPLGVYRHKGRRGCRVTVSGPPLDRESVGKSFIACRQGPGSSVAYSPRARISRRGRRIRIETNVDLTVHVRDLARTPVSDTVARSFSGVPLQSRVTRRGNRLWIRVKARPSS